MSNFTNFKNTKLTEQSPIRTPSHTVDRNSWILDKSSLKLSCLYLFLVSAELQDAGFDTIVHYKHRQIKPRKEDLKWH